MLYVEAAWRHGPDRDQLHRLDRLLQIAAVLVAACGMRQAAFDDADGLQIREVFAQPIGEIIGRTFQLAD